MNSLIRELLPSCEILFAPDRNALKAALEKYPDAIVVIDYALFDMRGFDDFLILQRRFSGVEWIFFSNELSVTLIRRILLEDNIGIVMKECVRSEIIAALNGAFHHQRYICRQITNLKRTSDPSIQSPTTSLTTTERVILILIAQGKSVKEIATERNSSIHTIITHKKNIFRKLEVNNVYEATKCAVRAGLVDLVEYYI